MRRKEPQQNINSATVEGQTGWVEGKKKNERETGKTKKTACEKQAHKPNHINTDWRTDGAKRVL